MARRSLPDDTGLEVSAEFFPLAFLLIFCSPRIVINDRVYKRSWGKSFFALEPGWYTVEVYYVYTFFSRCGYATLDVRVREGEIKRLNYYHWAFFVFMAGSLSPGGIVEEPGPPGSSSIRWALVGLILTILLPFLCCGGGVLMSILSNR